MATTISGKLINGIGEPIKNCKITLKSISTSTTVIAHTTASQTPSAAGDYSMSVEPGKYKVTLCVDGFPPEYVGDIQVYKDSLDGTLNYFLGLPQDDDLRPDAIKHFEAMADKVASQVAEVEKSKLAAEGSARSAAASADRASQITGLSTVTDAISMASVPLPDVWIPFNDSLQMLTGYGDEVKVGAVTVAKMVSFSRGTTATYIDKSGQLRVATINEPRFEKEGLLIEKSTTNLIKNSSNYASKNQYDIASETTLSPLNNGSTAEIFVANERTTQDSFVRFGDVLTGNVSEVRTASVYVKPIGADLNIVIQCEDVSAGTFLCKADVWTRISATRTIPNTQYNTFIDVLIYNAVPGQKFAAWGAQLEAGHEMTSLIISNGVMTTRVQDVCYLNSACNYASGINERTIAAEFDTYSPAQSERFPLLFAMTSAIPKEQMGVGVKTKNIFADFKLNNTDVSGGGINMDLPADVNLRGVFALSVSSKNCSLRFNNYFVSKTTQLPNGEVTKLDKIYLGGTGSAASLILDGHIRNFRMWHVALTDEQLKALK